MPLNDLALLFSQVDPYVPADVERLTAGLAEAAKNPALSLHEYDLVCRAGQKLTEAREADPDACADAVSRAARLVEWAMLPPEDDILPVPVQSAGKRSEPQDGLPADADLELLGSFVEECREHLESAEAGLLALEADPDDAEACNTVFRAFHTVKGGSAFLGLDDLTELAHGAESLLSRIRDREVRYHGRYPDLALQSVDMVQALLGAVDEALAGEALRRPEGYDALLLRLADAEADAPDADEESEVVDFPDTSPADAAAEPSPASTRESGRTSPAQSDASVRVRTDRLDRLIDLVGELVIAQSMIAQDPALENLRSADLARKTSHSGKIVRELQDLSVSLRMVPFHGTFQKMARLVRDVARKRGKQVHFVTEGDDTEIDRGMVDIIGDPLVHMIRNAVDHGIEPTGDRLASGKPEAGRVWLSAKHAGGNVVVELCDDGKGLDRDRILHKALQNGVVTSDKGMSDSEIYQLIFAPGFSTAEQVTDVSGRGVGMDVVKRHVEMLRGRIDISSTSGEGTLFTVRFPLTLAMTDGMLVRVGADRYIVPTATIQRSFRPAPEALSTVAGRGEMVRTHGRLLPILRLHRLLGGDGAEENPVHALLMVIGAGDRPCALLVDEILDQQQVVAKALGEGIGKVPGVSGAAILGDGKIGLILDVPALVELPTPANWSRAAA